MSMMAPESPNIQALLQQLGIGQDQGPPPDQGTAPDPLQTVQQVIQDLHSLIAVLPDPTHTRVASQCLTQLLAVQKDLMGAAQQTGGGY